jgi:hypothetical protein
LKSDKNEPSIEQLRKDIGLPEKKTYIPEIYQPKNIKELCRQFIFNDRLIERLASIGRGEGLGELPSYRDQMHAIELLLDRAYGKSEQFLDITRRDEGRPSTDTLIQTITALRGELDAVRKGTGVEKGE